MLSPRLSTASAHHDEGEGIVALWIQPTRYHEEDCGVWGRVAQTRGKEVRKRGRAYHLVELLIESRHDGILGDCACCVDDV
ncbi:MAG TPA: hypothetical protein VKE72_00175 [Methylocella sp.]|nr:hypothetical protein [Methylocella sp.]